MAKIFITGSADGLGQLAAKALVDLGHDVFLHARNDRRGKDAHDMVPGARAVLVGDLSSINETKALAIAANKLGPFDAVIHNAGIYRVSKDSTTIDGLPLLFAVNSLAPYILTAMIRRPKRLIYLSSGMHEGGSSRIDQLSMARDNRKFNVTYSDTKLHDLILSMAVARKWPNVYANTVNPGWVPTKMGGAGAPDDLQKGFETQVWLAVSNDVSAIISGQYFHHKKAVRYLNAADDVDVQEKYLSFCEKVSGVSLDSQ